MKSAVIRIQIQSFLVTKLRLVTRVFEALLRVWEFRWFERNRNAKQSFKQERYQAEQSLVIRGK